MKKIFGIPMIIFVVISVFLINAPLIGAQEKSIELNFADFFPVSHPNSILFDEWGKEVEKETNGRVKVTLFPGGMLTPAAQVYASIVGGLADVGVSFNAYTKGRFPLTDFLTHPLGNKDGYQGSMLAHAFYKNFKPKEFDEVKVLWLQNAPPQGIASTKPIRSLEDINGLKVRAGGGVEASILEALGAIPVALPMPDVYDALQKGAINAYMGSAGPLKNYKLGEVLSYYTYFGLRANGAGYVVMNKDKWNAIPPDAQKIIDKINDKYAEKQAELWNNINKDGEDYFTQKGGEIIVISEKENVRWDDKIRPVSAKYVKELNSQGLPGDAAWKFCTEYIESK